MHSLAPFTWNKGKRETVGLVVNAAAIVPRQMKILTMAIKKQLRNVVGLTYNHFTVHFFLASLCYRSVESIYKHNKQIFRLR